MASLLDCSLLNLRHLTLVLVKHAACIFSLLLCWSEKFYLSTVFLYAFTPDTIISSRLFCLDIVIALPVNSLRLVSSTDRD